MAECETIDGLLADIRATALACAARGPSELTERERTFIAISQGVPYQMRGNQIVTDPCAVQWIGDKLHVVQMKPLRKGASVSFSRG